VQEAIGTGMHRVKPLRCSEKRSRLGKDARADRNKWEERNHARLSKEGISTSRSQRVAEYGNEDALQALQEYEKAEAMELRLACDTQRARHKIKTGTR